MEVNTGIIRFLQSKVRRVKKETLEIHKASPETRLASSLSPIEIFVTLYYAKILNFNPKNTAWKNRDRFIVSKGHGAIALYSILADLGFFKKRELKNICREGSCFGSIPDSSVPGFEAINGSLGHGLGLGCGMAIALKNKKINSRVFVLVGDGELYEGSNWEAIMFADHHRLNNLILIVDNNKISMLDYCKNIIDLSPLADKFKGFNWRTRVVDGHNLRQLYIELKKIKADKSTSPKVLIANTIKGKGVAQLENNPLCHVKSIKAEDIELIIRTLEKNDAKSG